MEKKYKVAGYLRLSVEDGDKDVSDSIVSQKSIIEHKVKELGKEFELVDFYIDDGYTGLNVNRPAFQKMLLDLESSKVNTVITKDLSRLSRNSFEANYYIELYFLERNIRYISILDNVDTSIKSTNNDMIQFKTLINDWYSKDISRKVRSGVWARKEKGLYLASKAPYGYEKSKTNKNKLVINPEQARIVKLIFEKFDKGETQTNIAKYLEENKVICPFAYDKIIEGREYDWKSKSLGKMLRNKIYLGHTEYGKRINLSYKSEKVKYIPRDEWKIAYNTHEAIITEEQFERVQRRLNLKKKTKRRKYDWLFNGLVYCKECGSQMILKVEYDYKDNIRSKRLHCSNGLKKNGTISCNRKSKGIDEETLTRIALLSINKKIKKLINSERLQEFILKQYNESETKVFDDNIKILEKQLEKVEKTIKTLYEDYRNELLEEDDYKRFYKVESEKRISLKSNINQIQEERNNRPILTEETLKDMLSNISNIDEWSRDKLSEIIYKVEVDMNNNILINYRYNIFNMVK